MNRSSHDRWSSSTLAAGFIVQNANLCSPCPPGMAAMMSQGFWLQNNEQPLSKLGVKLMMLVIVSRLAFPSSSAFVVCGRSGILSCGYTEMSLHVTLRSIVLYLYQIDPDDVIFRI